MYLNENILQEAIDFADTYANENRIFLNSILKDGLKKASKEEQVNTVHEYLDRLRIHLTNKAQGYLQSRVENSKDYELELKNRFEKYFNQVKLLNYNSLGTNN